MTSRIGSKLVATALAASLVLGTPALANDQFIGGLVGGVIGGLIGSQINNNQSSGNRSSNSGTRTQRKPAAPKPSISPAQREENKHIQIALNALSCDAGTPDGVFGQRTRTAIRCFQAIAEKEQTGTLTTDEKALLLAVYADTQTGGGGAGGTMPQMVGSGGAGALIDALKNNSDTAPQAQPDVPPIGDLTEAVAVETVAQPAAAAAICQSAPAATSLPGIAAPAPVAYVDDIPAVGFCGLRAALMDGASESLKGFGLSLTQAQGQCAALSAQLASASGAIAQSPPVEVIDLAAEAVRPMVSDLDKAVTTARFCAGVGYAADDMSVVETAGLFGAAIGDPSLVEVLGWQLAFGIGRDKDGAAGAEWLLEAAAQLEEIDPSITLMAETDRPTNLRAVAAALTSQPASSQSETSAASFTLPGIKN